MHILANSKILNLRRKPPKFSFLKSSLPRDWQHPSVKQIQRAVKFTWVGGGSWQNRVTGVLRNQTRLQGLIKFHNTCSVNNGVCWN